MIGFEDDAFAAAKGFRNAVREYAEIGCVTEAAAAAVDPVSDRYARIVGRCEGANGKAAAVAGIKRRMRLKAPVRHKPAYAVRGAVRAVNAHAVMLRENLKRSRVIGVIVRYEHVADRIRGNPRGFKRAYDIFAGFPRVDEDGSFTVVKNGAVSL